MVRYATRTEAVEASTVSEIKRFAREASISLHEFFIRAGSIPKFEREELLRGLRGDAVTPEINEALEDACSTWATNSLRLGAGNAGALLDFDVKIEELQEKKQRELDKFKEGKAAFFKRELKQLTAKLETRVKRKFETRCRQIEDRFDYKILEVQHNRDAMAAKQKKFKDN